ncbi:MAG: hypothetical protein HC888_12600, partial [Candidatus Competibacteraceae bacterium]|nr:hypothetical protein [Candidatus Competibacteraceae bacterium]
IGWRAQANGFQCQRCARGPGLGRIYQIGALQALVDSGETDVLLTTPLRGDGKFRNCTIWFRAGHSPRIVYSKIHLFDVDVEGAPPVRESDHFHPGEAPAVLHVKGWKIGLSICYDLRFAELYLRYAQSVDLILIPAAFLVPTGEAHWHVLVRARAIEAQAYVAAPAQAGGHRSVGRPSAVRATYGHSLVVDPWGVVLADLGSGVGLKVVTLEREAIAKVRRQIPMAGHRRLK